MKRSGLLHKIYSIFFVMLFLTLCGCASVPSKTTSLTEQMIQSNKGDFQGLWIAWIKPQLNFNGVVAVNNIDESDSTINAIASDFKRFCSSMGGITASTEQKFGRKSMCASAAGEYLGEFNTNRYKGGVEIVVDSKELKKEKIEATAKAEEAARKRKYQRLTLDSLSISELSELINQFNNNDPAHLIPKAKEKLVELRAAQQQKEAVLVAERNKQKMIEEAARRARQEKKGIGDQVCINRQGTVEQDTGYIIFGQRHYKTILGDTRIVGFVEGIAGKKIQVRVSGINFFGNDGINKPLDFFSNFNDGLTLKINSIIWDSIYNWDGC